MSVEERVRAAARERADLVRDIRPLEFPAAKPARPFQLPPGRGWSTWLAPVAAAAVVVALAIALVSIREAANEPSVLPTSYAAPGGADTAGTAPPRYYAALDDPSGTAFNDKTTAHVVDVAVGDAKTGKLLATIAPPAGQTFAGLTAAAADDSTFVVAAQAYPVPAGYPTTAPVAWYLLRLSPDRQQAATLTKLRIPGQPHGTQVSGISLSPDGSQLAVLYQRGVWGIGAKTGPLALSVYSVATGRALRTWTQPTKGVPVGYGWYWGSYSNSSLTWLDGGLTLAFDEGALYGSNGPPLSAAFANVKIRTIDVTRPSNGALFADSKIVFSSKYHWCETLQLTADGKTVFCGSYGANAAKPGTDFAEILRYSVATGASRLVYRIKGAFNLGLGNVLWLNPNGSTLIASFLAQAGLDGQAGFGVASSGVISKGTLKQLNFPLGPSYAGQIAF
jgi:hypothetical protein